MQLSDNGDYCRRLESNCIDKAVLLDNTQYRDGRGQTPLPQGGVAGFSHAEQSGTSTDDISNAHVQEDDSLFNLLGDLLG